MSTAEVEKVEQQGLALIGQAEEVTVTDVVSFQGAGVFLRTIAGYIKKVGEVLDPIVTAAHHAHKVAVDQRKKLLEPAQVAERLVKVEMSKYEQGERDRVAREQREAEALRRRIEDEARLAAAVVLEAQGQPEAAARALTAPIAVPTFTPPVVPVTKVDGVSFRDQWDFEVEDEALIPREYLVRDDQKIRAVVRALKGETTIPGIRAVCRRISAVKA